MIRSHPPLVVCCHSKGATHRLRTGRLLSFKRCCHSKGATHQFQKVLPTDCALMLDHAYSKRSASVLPVGNGSIILQRTDLGRIANCWAETAMQGVVEKLGNEELPIE